LQGGAGRRDITPREPVPMWGYGDRHDALSVGVLDPLYADALVIQAGGRKIAIVGLNLGRVLQVERRLGFKDIMILTYAVCPRL
jgi:hypothetical protein